MTSQVLHASQEPFSDPSLYRSTLGSLHYLLLTQPDITFVVNKLSQFAQSPTVAHWKALKRVLRYLHGTSSLGLHLEPVSFFSLTAFSDADWAACPIDRRSVNGFCVYFGSSLISWSSKKQQVVARSSTESEYRALAHTACNLAWI